MEDKLAVGMYVRTKKGIAKIIDYEAQKFLIKLDKEIMYENLPEYYDYAIIGDVLKASHNIIDLIEVGDYLNGFKVSKIERYDTKTIIKIGNSTFNVLEGEEIYTPSYDNNNGYEKLEKLKSIVTKEMFENISYEVK